MYCAISIFPFPTSPLSLSLSVPPPPPPLSLSSPSLPLQTMWLFWTDYNSTLIADRLYTSEEVKVALTLHPIKDPNAMLRVHLYLQQLRVQSLLGQAARVQADAVQTARLLPASMNRFGSRVWLWYRAGLNPGSRHALTIWEYFNSTVLFSAHSRRSPVANLPPSHVAGVNMALEVLLGIMESDGHGPFSPKCRLEEGFVAQDPSSGVSYALVVSLMGLRPSLGAVRYVARVFLPLLGPGLSHYQMAAEAFDTRLHVAVAVTRGDILDRFLHMYHTVCLKMNSATHLHLVLLNDTTRSTFLEELVWSYGKSITCYHANGLSTTDAHSLVARSLSDHTQLLLMRPDLEFTAEFLDHCRMNTLKGMQVFSPVPFSMYSTDLPGQNTPPLGYAGFFLHHSYEVVCIYTSDYLDNVRPLMLDEPHPLVKPQLINRLALSNLYVMRALEPHLVRPYIYGQCSTLKGQQKTDCILAQVEAIGSKKLLASLLAASYELEWI